MYNYNSTIAFAATIIMHTQNLFIGIIIARLLSLIGTLLSSYLIIINTKNQFFRYDAYGKSIRAIIKRAYSRIWYNVAIHDSNCDPSNCTCTISQTSSIAACFSSLPYKSTTFTSITDGFQLSGIGFKAGAFLIFFATIRNSHAMDLSQNFESYKANDYLIIAIASFAMLLTIISLIFSFTQHIFIFFIIFVLSISFRIGVNSLVAFENMDEISDYFFNIMLILPSIFLIIFWFAIPCILCAVYRTNPLAGTYRLLRLICNNYFLSFLIGLIVTFSSFQVTTAQYMNGQALQAVAEYNARNIWLISTPFTGNVITGGGYSLVAWPNQHMYRNENPPYVCRTNGSSSPCGYFTTHYQLTQKPFWFFSDMAYYTNTGTYGWQQNNLKQCMPQFQITNNVDYRCLNVTPSVCMNRPTSYNKNWTNCTAAYSNIYHFLPYDMYGAVSADTPLPMGSTSNYTCPTGSIFKRAWWSWFVDLFRPIIAVITFVVDLLNTAHPYIQAAGTILHARETPAAPIILPPVNASWTSLPYNLFPYSPPIELYTIVNSQIWPGGYTAMRSNAIQNVTAAFYAFGNGINFGYPTMAETQGGLTCVNYNNSFNYFYTIPPIIYQDDLINSVLHDFIHLFPRFIHTPLINYHLSSSGVCMQKTDLFDFDLDKPDGAPSFYTCYNGTGNDTKDAYIPLFGEQLPRMFRDIGNQFCTITYNMVCINYLPPWNDTNLYLTRFQKTTYNGIFHFPTYSMDDWISAYQSINIFNNSYIQIPVTASASNTYVSMNRVAFSNMIQSMNALRNSLSLFQSSVGSQIYTSLDNLMTVSNSAASNYASFLVDLQTYFPSIFANLYYLPIQGAYPQMSLTSFQVTYVDQNYTYYLAGPNATRLNITNIGQLSTITTTTILPTTTTTMSTSTTTSDNQTTTTTTTTTTQSIITFFNNTNNASSTSDDSIFTSLKFILPISIIGGSAVVLTSIFVIQKIRTSISS